MDVVKLGSGWVKLNGKEWDEHDRLSREVGKDAAVAYATQEDLRRLTDKEW